MRDTIVAVKQFRWSRKAIGHRLGGDGDAGNALRSGVRWALTHAPGRSATNRVVVLLYHQISSTAPQASASPKGFRDHVAWLKDTCEVVPFRDVVHHANRTDLDRPVVAITFDDGFADSYHHAWPILVEQSLPATFFVTTGLLDASEPIVDRFRQLLECTDAETAALSWDQVREIHASGMEIGVHTVSHANLAQERGAAVRWELVEAKNRVEQELGDHATSFAYPFGKPRHHVTPSTVSQVSEAGFEMAATTSHRGVRPGEHPLRIPRFCITGDDLGTLQGIVAGRLDLLGAWQERAPRWLSHLISPDHSHTDIGSIRVPVP